jgi:histidine decarboxylase
MKPHDNPGHLPPADRRRLDALFDTFSDLARVSIGYPCNQDWDYSELYPFLSFVGNNIGDPYRGSNYRQNTHEFEREVLADFAEFTKAPASDYWGYVTNGGTEGNMYGLYLAREIYPEGIVYFSEDTHYSVAKILRLQHTRNIMIKSRPDGEIDYDDLRESIRLHRDVPPIIFANIGTTMKGAVDNLDTIRGIMDDLAISSFYLHADAALSGMILPFVAEPQPWNFDAGIDSLSISGHKLIGSPLPCGIVLARKKHVERVARSVEYVGVLDTTLSGSRNAFTPLLLWYALRKHGREGFTAIVQGCLSRAEYAVQLLRERGVEAWRNRNSITVVFPRPAAEVMEKWIIAPNKDIGHLLAMPHVTYEIIEEFVDDYGKALPSGTAKAKAKNRPKTTARTR